MSAFVPAIALSPRTIVPIDTLLPAAGTISTRSSLSDIDSTADQIIVEMSALTARPTAAVLPFPEAPQRYFEMHDPTSACSGNARFFYQHWQSQWHTVCSCFAAN
ncbi:MAG: hypothetical protein SGJ20_11550 [Planctomycetota bacterium]|nr:hypothetical protein [Planctomycetota bacterium]